MLETIFSKISSSRSCVKGDLEFSVCSTPFIAQNFNSKNTKAPTRFPVLRTKGTEGLGSSTELDGTAA